MAKALDVSDHAVKNWERDRSTPREPRLSAYKRLLDG
ncbi:hypothetical protein [Streptomyces sp. R08]|uniref:HTH cro/C1-type domain-containing protein n=1 Tax=Streptomyces sp. R08 TaxID=3238624 RepID=A0AB39MQA0_9ACTN